MRVASGCGRELCTSPRRATSDKQTNNIDDITQKVRRRRNSENLRKREVYLELASLCQVRKDQRTL